MPGDHAPPGIWRDDLDGADAHGAPSAPSSRQPDGGRPGIDPNDDRVRVGSAIGGRGEPRLAETVEVRDDDDPGNHAQRGGIPPVTVAGPPGTEQRPLAECHGTGRGTGYSRAAAPGGHDGVPRGRITKRGHHQPRITAAQVEAPAISRGGRDLRIVRLASGPERQLLDLEPERPESPRGRANRPVRILPRRGGGDHVRPPVGGRRREAQVVRLVAGQELVATNKKCHQQEGLGRRSHHDHARRARLTITPMSARTGRPFDLAVIGGGPAGVTAALRAAELGARVALVERDRPGGTCTDDGCAPTRVLARAARLVRDSEQLADYGLSSPRPSLDLRELLAATQRTVYELHEKKQLVSHLERAGILLLAGRGPARFTDARRVAVGDGTELDAERFIVACGGHARRLPFPGSELAITHGDVWTMRELPRSLAIVGAAATGAQLASIFAAFGTRVTLLELAPRIIPAEDEDMAFALAAAFAANGIDVVTGIAGVERIERDGRGMRLTYRQGDEQRTMTADTIMLAVGWPGNVEELGLAEAGVATERGYVTVDDTLRTSADTIWAAGDITGRMMLVQSATYEGRIAAENALGTGGGKVRHTIVAHGGFTDPEYGSVGLTEAAARAAGEVVVGVVPYLDLDRAVIDRRTDGFCKLVVDRNTRRVVGAHVIGEQAVEVVQIAATAMAAEMPVERLAEIELAYPTFTSIVALAARQVVHALRLGGEVEAWEAMGRPRQSEWERTDS